VSLIALARRQA